MTNLALSLTPGGIPFEELGGSPTIDIAQKKTTAKRMFRINWSDWQNFAQETLGGGAGFFGLASITDPSTFPGWSNLFVEGIDIEPFEPESPSGGIDIWTSTNDYDGGAKVTVNYESKDPNDDNDGKDKPDVPDGTFLTLSQDIGGEYQTMPGRSWKWESDGAALPADVNPGLLIPTSELTFSWERVTAPPWANIRDATGCVSKLPFPNWNSSSRSGLGYKADKYTLLFLGAKASRQFANLTEEAYWKLDYKFSERRLKSQLQQGFVAGWNTFYRTNPVANAPVTLDDVVDQANNKPYTVLDYAFDDPVKGLFVNAKQ